MQKPVHACDRMSIAHSSEEALTAAAAAVDGSSPWESGPDALLHPLAHARWPSLRTILKWIGGGRPQDKDLEASYLQKCVSPDVTIFPGNNFKLSDPRDAPT
jgi:hypothetical protein